MDFLSSNSDLHMVVFFLNKPPSLVDGIAIPVIWISQSLTHWLTGVGVSARSLKLLSPALRLVFLVDFRLFVDIVGEQCRHFLAKEAIILACLACWHVDMLLEALFFYGIIWEFLAALLPFIEIISDNYCVFWRDWVLALTEKSPLCPKLSV